MEYNFIVRGICDEPILNVPCDVISNIAKSYMDTIKIGESVEFYNNGNFLRKFVHDVTDGGREEIFCYVDKDDHIINTNLLPLTTEEYYGETTPTRKEY